ncbi:APC family permease [Silvibacterium acidisoli]|uniref:APC family permease n=1 Tax=Acidobacteriaceae bacterium ZG23-2 TaxID=2883246 RepID=UPI00406C9296
MPPETVPVLADRGATTGYGLRKQVLGPWETLAQSVSAIAPTASPAMTIPLVFALSGNGTWLTYLLATLAMTLVGLVIGCFARRSASPGSLFTYTAESMPGWAACVSAWALLLAYVATASSVAAGFFNYANVLAQAALGRSLSPVMLLVIAVLAAGAMAYRDIKLSAEAMLWMEGASVTCIVAILSLTVWKHGLHFDMAQLSLHGVKPSGIGLGIVLALFSFVGFESATTLGEEARNPLVTIPRAVLQCAVGCGVFFVLSAYAEVVGFRGVHPGLQEVAAPLHALAAMAGVNLLGVLVDIGAMVSLFACTLACITAASRVLLLMAHRGLVPAGLGRTHARNETPHAAVVITAAATFIPPVLLAARGVSGGDIYGWMGALATYGFLTAYALVCVALPLHLRRVETVSPGVLLLSLAAFLAMVLAMAGSVYPIPAAPYSWLPYIYLGYLALGLSWYGLRRT